ncbi:undecaprenyldiphospho-muramoylpentapeptide beta-N-acetylglucosaminyltransferase [Trichlorobacter ammonificans]|uniref:UDP-N-acetylglucosamine--N-acetylmuramyl-(pentapeptide) pyrophosphoryl-undecaprenol N-acetylglucosamine transferase n=1 Tax=Trichlorobacter ammonificans TaxID=2916410 RepID=A0ABM9DAK5_9BACT|nr:undecaprenyldiphospho-muramoylpentapeptide beta-N-acetylglucosaminyltransferase [Trichlorobacter ammonificans]CAH2032250.1 UDP-N-acetylglucosamine--N-acetylmuramyl-(pentapeptide) pyrophosphoryl-undecaprenol N-acetylglucosamine transferase [Trichlorobacter ammonificans]
MKLIVAGGGTGGHLFPGIAVAEEFLSRDSSNQVLFVGSERGIEARVIPSLGYPLELVSAAGIKGKGFTAKVTGALQLLYGYAQSRTILKRYRPDLVLGVGGYASLPMVLAARGLDIPRFIHEQNALPGMTNKLLSRFADRVFISLEEARQFFPEERTLLTGNPLRTQILESLQHAAVTRERTPDAPFHLFVFGGSQGARPLNEVLPRTMALLNERAGHLRIVHQTGEQDLAAVRQGYREAGIDADVRPFIDDMAREYRRADLIVCRAGATTIAEVTAIGKACLFIPFPHATDDHQRKNAEALLKNEACELMLERHMTPETLAGTIAGLMDDRERLERIGRNAAGMARLEAARVIVDEMLKGLQPCTET